MSSGASEIVIEPLLFSWDSPRQQKAVLAIFVGMSLVGHAFCFYVFQIAYPTPVALLQRGSGSALVMHTETRTTGGELVNEQWVTEFFRGIDAPESRGEQPSPYEVLLNAALTGNNVRFTRQDGVEEQWRVVSVDRQVNLQLASQPVPGPLALPLSHSSGASTTPSPHDGATQFRLMQ